MSIHKYGECDVCGIQLDKRQQRGPFIMLPAGEEGYHLELSPGCLAEHAVVMKVAVNLRVLLKEDEDPEGEGSDVCPTCQHVGIRKALELTMEHLEEYLLKDAQCCTSGEPLCRMPG